MERVERNGSCVGLGSASPVLDVLRDDDHSAYNCEEARSVYPIPGYSKPIMMSAMLIDPPNRRVSLNIRDPDFYQDPYPFYETLHQDCPVFHWTEPDLWTFTRHADVNAILRDRRFGRQISHLQTAEQRERSQPRPELKPFFDIDRLSMIGLEPPAHTRLRGLVQKAFVGRQVQEYRPQVETLCHELIDQIIQDNDNATVDLLASYATPIPVCIIAQMLGVPDEMTGELLRWSHDMVQMYEMQRTPESELAAVKASQEFVRYLRNLVSDRRRKPKNDLISQLIAVEAEGEKLTEEELIANCILLLNAGHEATVNVIGNGMLALLNHPDQMQRWRDNIGSSAEFDQRAVEELLRYDTPLHQFNRWVLEPLTLHGRRFEVGQEIALLLGAANRDALVFDAASQLDLTRKHNPHVSFGGGIHYCLGASLARLEIQVAIPTLLRRLPDLQLARTPSFRNHFHFRGLEALLVSF